MFKQNTKKIRVLSIVLLVLTVLFALSSCGESSSEETKLTVTTITSEQVKAENGLTADALNTIANKLATESNRYLFLAACRGYDVTNGEVAGTNYEADNGINIDCVKAVLAKVGASDYDAITEVDVTLIKQALSSTVSTEDGTGFMVVIGKILSWFTTTLAGGRYVIGVCIFSIAIELLMTPLAIKQQKNTIKQSALGPKVQAIKNKYKGRNDQPTMQKMQQEIQEMYSKEGFSPYSGCLPLLVQLPIAMILYYIVLDPMTYVMGINKEFVTAIQTFVTAPVSAGGLAQTISVRGGKVELLNYLVENKDFALSQIANFGVFSNAGDVATKLTQILTVVPNFNIGTLNLGYVPGFFTSNLWFVPVLVAVSQFAVMKIQRKFMPQPATSEGVDPRQAACSNWMMDLSMPLLTGYFSCQMPAVIGVYWAFRSWIGLLKSFVIAKIMPVPTYTEEDVRKAEKELKGKKVTVTKSERAGLVRSLHHIDDEDFDDTREAALERKARMEAYEAEQKAKKEKGVELAGMKEENAHDNAEENNEQ